MKNTCRRSHLMVGVIGVLGLWVFSARSLALRNAQVSAELGKALASDNLDLDKDTFYKAIHALLDHEHMWARNAGMSLLRNMPREELPRIIDKLLHVIEDKDPGYTTYHNNKRTIAAGLEILKGFGIEDPTGKSGKDVLNAIE